MCNTPTWVQYLQALSTPTIAFLAVTIGVLQWRTAHQRAVLDLFDRRLENYDSLNAAISEIVREGKATFESLVCFSRAADRARFLFGKDVTAFLDTMRTTIVNLRRAEAAARTDDDTKRATAADLEAANMMKITEFYEEFYRLVRPYVKMHQKAPPV
jgi:hypothetical protein